MKTKLFIITIIALVLWYLYYIRDREHQCSYLIYDFGTFNARRGNISADLEIRGDNRTGKLTSIDFENLSNQTAEAYRNMKEAKISDSKLKQMQSQYSEMYYRYSTLFKNKASLLKEYEEKNSLQSKTDIMFVENQIYDLDKKREVLDKAAKKLCS